MTVRPYKPILPNTNTSWSSGSRSYSQGQYSGSEKGAKLSKLPNAYGQPAVKSSRRLTSADMDEKWAKGLCFWCDEKYTPGHVCKKKKQLFILEVEEGGEEREVDEYMVEEETCEDSALIPQMSVHSLDGTVESRTARVKRGIREKMVHVLIDSCNDSIGYFV